MILAVCDPTPEVMAWIKQRFGSHTGLVITSPFDIRRTVERLFGTAMETSSRLSLWQKVPQSSARVMMVPRQRHVIYGLADPDAGDAIAFAHNALQRCSP